jgi:signal transduction histidine kinase
MTRSEAAAIVARLNETSFSDAAATRDEVVKFLRAMSGVERTSFIEQLAVSAQSRLRQSVARAVQLVETDGDLALLLERWLANETDEFARAAIEDALTPVRRPERRPRLLTDLDAVPRTYQYLADRLRHRVLNTMPGAGLSVTKLKDVASVIENDQHRHALLHEIDHLSTAFTRLQRALDFVEEKSRFERAHLNLTEWLHTFSAAYRVQTQEIEMHITAAETPATVVAVPYLLETTFGNLFDNARQAVDAGGRIILDVTVRSRDVRVLVSDSGPGLPDSAAKVAFQMPVTTKIGRDRGRGLLEVADAMRRLAGHAEITHGASGNRVLLTFPLVR